MAISPAEVVAAFNSEVEAFNVANGTNVPLITSCDPSALTATYNKIVDLMNAQGATNATVTFIEPSALASALAKITFSLPIPANITVPTISGTAQVGATLTATTGTWTNTPTSYAYQWAYSGGADIGGATASTYVPVSGDIGQALIVKVTASNTHGASAPTSSAATAAVIDQIFQNIAARGQMHTALSTASAPKLEIQARLKYKVIYSTNTFKLQFQAIYLSNGAGPTYTINKCALEQGASFVPVTFSGGSRSITVTTGTVIESDEISTFPLTVGIAWARVDYSVTTSGYSSYPVYKTTQTETGGTVEQGMIFDPANTIDQIDGTGTLSVPSGASLNVAVPCPAALIGKVTSDKVSWLGGCTSIEDGKLDMLSSDGANGGGYLRRAACIANVPYASFALTGMGYFQVGTTSKVGFVALCKYHSTLLLGGPTNDVFQSKTLAFIQGSQSLGYFWGAKTLTGSTINRIVQGDLFPRVSTTDHDTTFSGQTNDQTGFAAAGVADQFQAFQATMAGTNNVDAIFQVRPTFQSSTDNHMWGSVGGADSAYSFFSATLAASALSSALTISLTAQPPATNIGLILDPGGAQMAPVTGSTLEGIAPYQYTGTGPYTASMFVSIAVAQDSGNVVTTTFCADGVHISGYVGNYTAATIVVAAA